MKRNVRKAKQHLTKLRKLISKRTSPLSDLKEKEVLAALRKTREELWDSKITGRLRI